MEGHYSFCLLFTVFKHFTELLQSLEISSFRLYLQSDGRTFDGY